MGFQTQVNANQAPAVAGDWASANPRASVLAGPGELVAGANGVTVGKFAWATDALGLVSNAHPGVPSARFGFVQRDQAAVIVDWLAEYTMTVQSGVEVTLFNEGDVWTPFAAGATYGQRVFASYADGSAIAGTAGSPPTGAVVTASIGATVTGVLGLNATGAVGSAFTGEISGSTLTVSALTGYVSVGDVITGASVANNTVILAQLTGTAGAAGTYSVSVSQTVASESMIGNSTVLVVSAIANGSFAVGNLVKGNGLPLAGVSITSQLSGTAGSTGRYQTDADAPFRAASTNTLYAPTGTLTVTAVSGGILHLGDEVTGSGVTAGTTIVALGTGTGGTGTYTVTPAQNAASTTLTVDSEFMDVSAVASGALAAGQPISGTSVDSGTTVTGQVSGTTGGVGVYTVSPAQNAASTTITAVGAYETGYWVQSFNIAAGELAKISTRK